MKKSKPMDYKDIFNKMSIIDSCIRDLKVYDYDMSFLMDYVDEKDIIKYSRLKKLNRFSLGSTLEYLSKLVVQPIKNIQIIDRLIFLIIKFIFDILIFMFLFNKLV